VLVSYALYPILDDNIADKRHGESAELKRSSPCQDRNSLT
jgi:hypothetical protein